jgi:acetoacetate decarboxylase
MTIATRAPSESALAGRLTRDQLPWAMADLYPTDPAWVWTDAEDILIDYETPVDAARNLLPSEFTVLESSRDGMAMARLEFARYGGGTLGPYHEVMLKVPCLFEGRVHLYVPYIWVNSDRALTSGREVTGFPKQLAAIHMESTGHRYDAWLSRDGQRIVSFTFTRGDPLFSLPLSKTAPPRLPAPFDRTLPLPAGETEVSHFALTTRYIPLAVEAQHVESIWTWPTGATWSGDASVDSFPHSRGPMAALPVVNVLNALLFRGDIASGPVRLIGDMR